MATVLIVDDMQNIRRFMGLNLANNGHVVLEAEDAQQAFTILSEKSPAVIILDLALPEMDGWTFLSSLSEQLPHQATIPVILVTATVMDGYKQDKYPNIVNVIEKPFEMHVLVDAIDRALERSKS
jgi:two-component system chemotaxis response regulator CheY